MVAPSEIGPRDPAETSPGGQAVLHDQAVVAEPEGSAGPTSRSATPPTKAAIRMDALCRMR